MYDLICDGKLMENLFKDRTNLFIKENILSLKNLIEIFDGSLQKLLETLHKYIFMHFDSCPVPIKAQK